MYYCCYSCIVKYMYIYLLVCPFLMDHHFSAQSSREAINMINVDVRYLFWFIYYRICFGLFTIRLIRLWMLLFLHEADQQLGYLGMFKSLCLLQGSEPPSVKERQLCQFANESFQNKFLIISFCCKKLYDHTIHKYNSFGLAKMKCNKFIHYKNSRNQN